MAFYPHCDSGLTSWHCCPIGFTWRLQQVRCLAFSVAGLCRWCFPGKSWLNAAWVLNWRCESPKLICDSPCSPSLCFWQCLPYPSRLLFKHQEMLKYNFIFGLFYIACIFLKKSPMSVYITELFSGLVYVSHELQKQHTLLCLWQKPSSELFDMLPSVSQALGAPAV